MKEIILITGAGGSVAKVLSEKLEKEYTVRFLTRNKKKENDFEWNIANRTVDEKAFENVSHIIHLAGANISEKSWTEERKNEIIQSRTESAQLMLETLQKNRITVKTFISASAIGIYGAQTTEKIYTEDDEKGNDFLSRVVILWENAANEFLKTNVAERVVKIRIPIVLSAEEGALKKMSAPVKLGIGSPLGTGKQYMPWVHIRDLSSVFEFAVKNKEMKGAYNASAPEHINNKEFTEKTAQVLNKPLLLPNIPGFVLKLMFGELSAVLLNGSRTSSEKLQQAGFQYQFPNLEGALKDLFKKEQL